LLVNAAAMGILLNTSRPRMAGLGSLPVGAAPEASALLLGKSEFGSSDVNNAGDES